MRTIQIMSQKPGLMTSPIFPPTLLGSQGGHLLLITRIFVILLQNSGGATEQLRYAATVRTDLSPDTLAVMCPTVVTPISESTFTLSAHYFRLSTDLIDFAWGALEMHCGFCQLSDLHQKEKFREMFNFSGSDRSIGQSDRVMQIYASTLSNETAFAIQPAITHGHVKKPPSRRRTEVV